MHRHAFAPFLGAGGFGKASAFGRSVTTTTGVGTRAAGDGASKPTMRTTTDTTEANEADTNLESRGLLTAVESITIPEERPVATTDVVTRRVYNDEDTDPTPLQVGLVGNALARLSREGFVGRDRIGGLDVWFAPNIEAFDDAISGRENDGDVEVDR